jgi:ADP-ribose pyrophosphatase YjhB (NUDIX family)
MGDSTNRPILAASAVCFRDGKLLLARRAKPPQLWSLPGGRVELGETAADAARRELFEETGVDAEILGFAGYREAFLENSTGKLARHFVILAFSARWRSGEAIVGPEAAAVEWVAPDAVAQRETTEGLEEIVAAARKIVGV